MQQNCIQIENLSKRYSGSVTDCLSEINLSISSGDKFGILGPNGAGKTTLISILCGVLEQTSGKVKYYDNDHAVNFNMIQSKIGFVPQEYALYQELTPLQNLEYFGALYNLKKNKIAKESRYILDRLGLTSVADKKILSFSGGMKRRVNLALGIIHQPSILFLDEPTVGVDVQSKVAILKFLNELNEKGTTIIYTSHHLSEAEEFCNRIVLIDNGKVIIKGNLQNIMKDHKTENLKELFLEFTGEEYRD